MKDISMQELMPLYKELFVINSQFYKEESELANFFNFKGQSISAKYFNLVENILNAIPNKNYSMSNSFAHNINNLSAEQIQDIIQKSNSKFVFFWGDNEYSNNLNIKKCEPVKMNDKWILLTDNFPDLTKSKELKERLWLAIKSIFIK